jgi:hypothetical protein
MVGALPVLWLAARMQNASLAIPRGKVAALIKLSVPNMFLWNVLMILGVSMLSSGSAERLAAFRREIAPAGMVRHIVCAGRRHAAPLE